MRQVVLECTAASLPRMQELRAANALRKKTVDIADAYRGAGLVKKVLVVSHVHVPPHARILPTIPCVRGGVHVRRCSSSRTGGRSRGPPTGPACS